MTVPGWKYFTVGWVFLRFSFPSFVRTRTDLGVNQIQCAKVAQKCAREKTDTVIRNRESSFPLPLSSLSSPVFSHPRRCQKVRGDRRLHPWREKRLRHLEPFRDSLFISLSLSLTFPLFCLFRVFEWPMWASLLIFVCFSSSSDDLSWLSYSIHLEFTFSTCSDQRISTMSPALPTGRPVGGSPCSLTWCTATTMGLRRKKLVLTFNFYSFKRFCDFLIYFAPLWLFLLFRCLRKRDDRQEVE